MLEKIKTGFYQQQIEDLRQLLAEKGEAAYGKEKRQHPAVTLSGRLEDRKTLLQHSGLLQIDCDNVDDLGGLRDSLVQVPQMLAAWISHSGKGVKGAPTNSCRWQTPQREFFSR